MVASALTMRALTALEFGEADTLVLRLKQGDIDALGVVYDLHHEAVRAFARRLVGDDQAAEDLVHEVFVSLPRAIGRFKGDASLRTFLTGIAVNHARHHVRSAIRRRAAMRRFEADPVVAPAPHSPESHALRRDLAQALTRALDGLPMKLRVAFVLCDVEEQSSVDAAQVLGVPEATVRTRLHHARKRLRIDLEKAGVR